MTPGKGGYLRLRVPKASPEEPAASAGLRPINYSPSSRLPTQRVHKVLGEHQDTDESRGRRARGSMGASDREKCSEAEWNESVREMRGRRKSRQSYGAVNYLKCSVLFRSEPIRSADTTEYFTIVGTSTKRSLRNGLIQDLLSSTSPPTVVETHGDFNRRFSNTNSKKQPTFKTVWLTHFFLHFFFFLIRCIKAFLWD